MQFLFGVLERNTVARWNEGRKGDVCGVVIFFRLNRFAISK